MNRRFLQVFLPLMVCIASGCTAICPECPTVTPHPAAESQTPTPEPPEPLRVAYVKNGDIWLWIWDELDSIYSRITCDGSAQEVRISSDGKAVAYRTVYGELKAVKVNVVDFEALIASVPLDPNNKKVVELCSLVSPVMLISKDYLNGLSVHGGTGATIRSFEFAGNTNNLYFNVDVIGLAGGVDLFEINIDNLLPTRLVAPGQGGNFSISQSGQWMVITIPNQLILSQANGNNAKIIFTFLPICGFGAHEGPQVVWRSDSSVFFVVTPKIVDGVLFGHSILYFVDIYGNTYPQIELLALPHSKTIISPNGKYVVNMIDYGDLIDLHIIEPGIGSDSEYISYPKDEIGLVEWSPDEMGFIYWLGKPESRKFYYGRQGGSPFQVIMDYVVYSLPGEIIPFGWADNDSFLFIGMVNGQKFLVRYSLAGSSGNAYRVDMDVTSFDIPGN